MTKLHKTAFEGPPLAILIDCGDTLVDEATEVKDEKGASLRAELIPGAKELLLALKVEGFPLALVADGPLATFRNNLGPHGIFELFDAYAISGELGVEKPAPEIFRHALAGLAIRDSEYHRVLMLGNHLERDVMGANLLGITSVWINWAPRRAKVPTNELEVPDYTIINPLELLDVLGVTREP